MNAGALKRAKRDVRRRALLARDAIPHEERARIGERIAARLVAIRELAEPKLVLAFSSFGSEVPTGPSLAALLAAGHRIALPRIVRDELELRTWSPGEPLAETGFGAMEPIAGALVDPLEVDVIVTPAVAFDRAGGRVGYGGGFYDRLFRRTRPDAFRVGIAASVQVLGEPLPRGPFDLRVDAIVTEVEVVRVRRDERDAASRG
jgi:5-formyltetrahydrofolate cyclo-ligase